jgi:putative ABC transport system permease protein
LFLLVMRKMLRNKWMVICLTIGCLLAVATISCMPIYSNSIYQRMLIKDLENYQLENNQYPGRYVINQYVAQNASGEEFLANYHQSESIIQDGFIEQLGLPVLAESKRLTAKPMRVLPDIYAGDETKSRKVQFTAMEGIGDHVTMISGTLPSSQPDPDGVIEVMVDENAMGTLSLSTGDTAVVTYSQTGVMEPVKIRVTGVFRYADGSDLYWSQPQTAFKEVVVMDSALFEQRFLEEDGELFYSSSWNFALDYTQMKVQQSGRYQSVIASQQRQFTDDVRIGTAMGDILASYSSRLGSLSMTLWILQIPVILMLLLYVFMVSKLIVDYDSNDIAVQKSRGASNLQIFDSYLVEGALIGLVALLAGPLIGYAVCGVLGLSDGFLEFVSRKGIQVEMVPDAYFYALLAIAAFLVTMLVPVLMQARGNIVKHKRAKSRNTDKPFWKKFYLDVVLMGIALYGYFSYRNSMKMLTDVGVSGTDVPMDPLLFLISTLFILAAALLFLRLYPLLIRLVFRIGRKHWAPAAYASLINVSRTRSSHFLMVFLMMTVSLGIFNTVSARTVNTFIEDRVMYADGADLVITNTWKYDTVKVMYDENGNTVPYDENAADFDSSKVSNVYVYTEPDFVPYTQLDTIERATKVYRDNKASLSQDGSGARSLQNLQLMGIVPHEFGEVAWSRSDLLPVHINEYLNILTEDPSAVFISRSIAESAGIRPGDKVSLSWTGQVKSKEVTVCGVIDYWPTINPNQDADGETPRFIIANLGCLNEGGNIRPYEIWMKRAPDVTSEQIYQEFEEKDIKFDTIQNRQQDLVAAKNDPMLQGTNGMLTLGFIIIMTVTFIGFLIYWIFNIRERTLQFGILRAMGLSKRKLVGMIVWEQVLISGVAILVGVLVGTLSSNLFVPLLQMVYSPSEQVPPFLVVAYLEDYLRIFAVLGVMLVVGGVVLGVIISRIKMDQALKLGED